MKPFGIPVERRAMLYLTGDLVIALISIAVAYAIRFRVPMHEVKLLGLLQESTGASTFFLLANLLCLYVVEAYEPSRDFRQGRQLLRLWSGVAVATLCQMVVFYAFPNWWWGRGITLLTNGAFVFFLTLWRLAMCTVRPRLEVRLRTLILGADAAGQLIADAIAADVERREVYRLVGFIDNAFTEEERDDTLSGLPIIGAGGHLVERVKERRIGCIIVAMRSGMGAELTRQLLECKAAGVRIEDMRSVYKRMTGKVPIFHLSDTSLIFGPDFSGTRPIDAALLRIADVLISAVGLLLSAPIILLAGIAVRLETPGPALFLQERVGLNERPFTIVKLRTMGVDAEARTGAVWSQGPADPRVTRVGRFLRRSRIDELPQFFNVLRGDMSMVGPRPERQPFVDQLKEKIPFYGLRFAVKPGVTGWAQVRYRYGASEEDAAEKLCYDLYATQELNPLLYAIILVKTVQTVLMKPGS